MNIDRHSRKVPIRIFFKYVGWHFLKYIYFWISYSACAFYLSKVYLQLLYKNARMMERWFIKFIKNLSIAAEKCNIIYVIWKMEYSGVWAGFSTRLEIISVRVSERHVAEKTGMWYRKKPMWYRYFRCGIGIFPLRAFPIPERKLFLTVQLCVQKNRFL